MSLDAVTAVLAIPALAAVVLALLPGYWLTARLNVLVALATFLVALSLFFSRPQQAIYLHIDDLNNVFIVLTTFVGFTTSAFSASYIGHELEIGRLTPTFLRFYHSMYQILMFAMNLALVANNIGLMWVAIELATLTTVLMVGIYRTHEALEAAWKYFILGSVGIALALFGTILVYMAAQPVIGEGLNAMVWTTCSIRRCSMSPSCSCCSATALRSDSRRCTPGCRMPTPKVPPRSLPCCRGSSSTSRSMRCCASRCCSPSIRTRSRPVRCSSPWG
jgi:hydrogenase-4 component F